MAKAAARKGIAQDGQGALVDPMLLPDCRAHIVLCIPPTHQHPSRASPPLHTSETPHKLRIYAALPALPLTARGPWFGRMWSAGAEGGSAGVEGGSAGVEGGTDRVTHRASVQRALCVCNVIC
jgi:hypothetical protein